MDIRDALFNRIYELMTLDSNIVFITADQGAFLLPKLMNDFPTRCFNIGIAEQNLINVASGLTMGGKKVFCFGIASFITYRCYEQIKINISDNNLPVTIIGAGPGLSYGSDGPSHHAIYDVEIMRLLPNMMILTPRTDMEAREAVDLAYKHNGGSYIRLTKGNLPRCYGKYVDESCEVPFAVYSKECSYVVRLDLEKIGASGLW